MTPEETFKSFEAAQGRAGYDVDYMLDKFGQHRSRPMEFDVVSIGLNANDELVNLRKRVDELKEDIEQLEAENARMKAVVDEAFQMLGTADLWPADMIVTVKRAMEIIADQRSGR